MVPRKGSIKWRARQGHEFAQRLAPALHPGPREERRRADSVRQVPAESA